jgi:hypothetical protein
MLGLLAPVLGSVVLALLLGGSLQPWTAQRLRWSPLALVALGVQIPLYSPPLNHWPPLVAIGAALGIGTTFLVFLIVLRNAVGPTSPGLLIAALGIALNLTVMLANGGWMPRSADLPGRPAEGATTESTITNTARSGPETQLGWLGDSIVQPVWLPLANVVSPGDLLLSFGAAWWAYALTRQRRYASASCGL